MSKKVYLIRHGEVEAKVNSKGERLVYDADVHLSSEGIQQVKSLGSLLIDQGADIRRFYTSPYQRAKETTKILHTFYKNADIIEVNGIKDNISDGAIGYPLDHAVKGLAIPRLPSDETLEQAAHRVWNAFQEILRETKGKNIAVISHGHPIRIIKALFTEGATIESIVSMTAQEFQSRNYLSKSEAWKLIFRQDGSVTSEFITTKKDRSPDQKREN